MPPCALGGRCLYRFRFIVYTNVDCLSTLLLCKLEETLCIEIALS